MSLSLLAFSLAVFPVEALSQDAAPAGGRQVDTVLARRILEASSLPVGQSLGGIHVLEGAFVRPVQKRDTALIGDQILYGFSVRGVEPGTGFGLPEFGGDPRGGGIEFLTPWAVDTLSLPKKVRRRNKRPAGNLDLEYKRIITSFDEGDFRLPPIPVVRILPSGEVDTLLFKMPDILPVRTMPIDTATFVPHDIKGQVRYPLTFREVYPWVALGWFAVVLCILAYCLWDGYRRRRAMGDKDVRHDPPHIVALRKLEHLRGDSYWAPEKQKYFYSSATDALREYIAARYGVGAMEMTTAEIFSALKDTDLPPDLRDELRELFERSDYVKFAKYTATTEENSRVLPLAVRFVTTTYQSQPEGDEEETSDSPKDSEGGNSVGKDGGDLPDVTLS